jgi:hypothetical protein
MVMGPIGLLGPTEASKRASKQLAEAKKQTKLMQGMSAPRDSLIRPPSTAQPAPVPQLASGPGRLARINEQRIGNGLPVLTAEELAQLEAPAQNPGGIPGARGRTQPEREETKEKKSAAEIWRRAQAEEYRMAEAEGRELPLDDARKIIPSEEALRRVAERYTPIEEDN